jgi:hypothetical protein
MSIFYFTMRVKGCCTALNRAPFRRWVGWEFARALLGERELLLDRFFVSLDEFGREAKVVESAFFFSSAKRAFYRSRGDYNREADRVV